MTKYILANWKSHKNPSEVQTWVKEFCRLYHPVPHLKVIIAPPIVHLAPIYQLLQKQEHPCFVLAAQDISPFPSGPYTGAIAARIVQDLVEFAILGHSERRRYFRETNQEVANKVSEAMVSNIQPIICVDQPYARAQLAAVDDDDLEGVIIGYGPVEAAGINIPQSTKTVREAIAHLQLLAPDAPVLYGGSINAENAADYLDIPGVAGLMVGTASLNAEEFSRICVIAAK